MAMGSFTKRIQYEVIKNKLVIYQGDKKITMFKIYFTKKYV